MVSHPWVCWHNLGDNVDIRRCANILSAVPKLSCHILDQWKFSELWMSCHGTRFPHILPPSCSCQRGGTVCIFCALPNNTRWILEIRPRLHASQTFMFGPKTNFQRTVRCWENTSRTLFAAYLCPPLLNTPTIVAYAGRGRGDHIYGWIRSGQCKTHVKRRPDNVWTM